MNGLELQDILLTFPEGGRRRTVLDIPYLKVTSGEHIGIRGAWTKDADDLLSDGEALWQALTAGAVSTVTKEG